MSSMALERGTMKKGITGHEEEGIETDESQAWLDALLFTVKEAKAKTSRSIFREKYGHSAYSMMRARGS